MLDDKILRPTEQAYMMQIARDVSTRSTCIRHHVGAVLVKHRRILTTGYNGAPSGTAHCIDIGCPRKDHPSGTMHELCRAVHAEQNAIIQAALHGISTEGSSLFCTHQICMLCAKMLINAGVREVIYDIPYPDEGGLKILVEAGVDVQRFDHLVNPIEPRLSSEYNHGPILMAPEAVDIERELNLICSRIRRETARAVITPKKAIACTHKEREKVQDSNPYLRTYRIGNIRETWFKGEVR